MDKSLGLTIVTNTHAFFYSDIIKRQEDRNILNSYNIIGDLFRHQSLTKIADSDLKDIIFLFCCEYFSKQYLEERGGINYEQSILCLSGFILGFLRQYYFPDKVPKDLKNIKKMQFDAYKITREQYEALKKIGNFEGLIILTSISNFWAQMNDSVKVPIWA